MGKRLDGGKTEVRGQNSEDRHSAFALVYRAEAASAKAGELPSPLHRASSRQVAAASRGRIAGCGLRVFCGLSFCPVLYLS